MFLGKRQYPLAGRIMPFHENAHSLYASLSDFSRETDCFPCRIRRIPADKKAVCQYPGRALAHGFRRYESGGITLKNCGSILRDGCRPGIRTGAKRRFRKL